LKIKNDKRALLTPEEKKIQDEVEAKKTKDDAD
jgi:hypothetical protein